MSWLPVGGDALTLVGGIMRVPWLNFVVLVGIGKGLRYAIVVWLVLSAYGPEAEALVSDLVFSG